MDNNKLKAAIVGIGEMGWNHLRVFKTIKDVEVVGVADTNKETVERAEKEYGVRAYADFNKLLSEQTPDIVSIAVPTALHKDIAIAAIKRGINVLVEKPIALDEKEAEEIISAARENNVKLVVGHIERFNPAVIELKKRLNAKELGEIYKIDVERIGPFPKRVLDIGVIIDLSVHDIDIIHFLTGTSPERLYAEAQQKIHNVHEDSVVALLRYPHDLIAVLNINFLSPAKIRRISIFGKKGMFRVDYLNQSLKFFENPSYSGANEKNGDPWNISEGKVRNIDIVKKEPLLSELEAFVDCVKNDKPAPVSGEDALEALRLANLLKKSAQSEEKIKA